MCLTKYGIREWLGSGIIVLILIVGSLYLALHVDPVFFSMMTVLLLVAWLAIAAFFRDPRRRIDPDLSSLVSPADGVVKDIELVEDLIENKTFNGTEVVRIGIFLSVFNVHLNRAPCHMVIDKVIYMPGDFYDARDERAITKNESNALVCTGDANGKSFKIIVKQISGAIAKRIVCPVLGGDELQKGQKYGMIKFGSRTEVYLPVCDYIKIKVKVGDKVRAGTTVIAEVR